MSMMSLEKELGRYIAKYEAKEHLDSLIEEYEQKSKIDNSFQNGVMKAQNAINEKFGNVGIVNLDMSKVTDETRGRIDAMTHKEPDHRDRNNKEYMSAYEKAISFMGRTKSGSTSPPYVYR